MIKVKFRTKYEKIPKLYQVFDCSSSVEGGRGRPERIFGVCLSVKRIHPKPKWDGISKPSEIRQAWINDYGDITEVTYNGRIYDFKKEHDAEMFYNAIETELALEKL
jgi:hypothetical protein